MKNKLVVVAVLAVAAAAGCSNSNNEPSSSTKYPDCIDVWVAGETLPDDYDGCLDGPDSLVVPVSKDGVVWYNDQFSAKLGGVIEEGAPELEWKRGELVEKN